MVDLAQFPPETKARVLHSAADMVANSPYPSGVLPAVAARHELTVDEVKAIVERHGWPRPGSLRRAAEILRTGKDPGHAAAGASSGSAGGSAGDQELQMVDVEQLVPDPHNVREDLGDLTELARSIRDVGILQPIVVRRANGQHGGPTGEQLVIVMGHRRHAAARQAGLHQVPVIIRAGAMDPDEVLAAMIVENGQRLGLDPIEEARALARLKRIDHSTDAMLGERISKSQPYVSGRLALLSLTPPQQAAVRAGTLSLQRAIKLGRHQGGVTRPEPPGGRKSTAHLAWGHPLAEKASILCAHNGHHKNMPGRPGSVACGQCWENVIRSDERERLSTSPTATPRSGS